MTSTRPLPATAPRASVAPIVLAAALGAAIALSLGIYGRLHTPTGDRIADFAFSSVLEMKAWFATGAAALAVGQLLSALWMWGRLPGLGTAPSSAATFHRWSGTAAFFLSLPVAYHCLWSLGFQTTTARVLVHSTLGCAFYGAFATKLLALRSKRLPRRTIPLVGGALVVLLTGIWFTSSYWYFTTF